MKARSIKKEMLSIGATTLLCVGIVFALAFLTGPRKSEAQVVALSGYIWSASIGWISLNCATGGVGGANICGTTNYALSIDQATGDLSGYAWSAHIGWISAQPADTAGCPAGTCQPRVVGSALRGWLKARSANGNGWDGYISLNCLDSGTCAAGSFAVTYSAGVFGGYAWGDAVVGWISFSTAIPPAATCALTPSDSNILEGQTITLDYTTTNATGMSINQGVGAVAVPTGAPGPAVAPTVTTTYTGTASGPGGSNTCPATVNVTCGDYYYCSGNQVMHKLTNCSTTAGPVCVSPLMCVNGQAACQAPTITGGNLQAKPQLVRTGATSSIGWNVQNAGSCMVSSPINTWSGFSSTTATCTTKNSFGCVTAPIYSAVTFTLYCTPIAPATQDFTQTVTIVPSPTYEEQ